MAPLIGAKDVEKTEWPFVKHILVSNSVLLGLPSTKDRMGKRQDLRN